MDEESRCLADWVSLWFGTVTAGRDPRELVAPHLTFNSAPGQPRRDGDVDVLVVEQQGVWLWGRTDSGAYVERASDDDVPWRGTGEDEVGFWLHHAAFEATWAMPASRSAQDFDGPTVSAILAGAAALPCEAWTWPGSRQRMFFRGSSLVMVCEDGDDFWVVAAAPREAELGWLDELDLDWDESDSRRGGPR